MGTGANAGPVRCGVVPPGCPAQARLSCLGAAFGDRVLQHPPPNRHPPPMGNYNKEQAKHSEPPPPTPTPAHTASPRGGLGAPKVRTVSQLHML